MRSVVFLTGAGATLLWNGDTTNQITNKINKDNDFITLSGKPIGLFFFDLLQAHYNQTKELINFETLINLLEELFNYCHGYNYHGRIDMSSVSSLMYILKDTIVNEIFQLNKIYNYDPPTFISKNNKNIFLDVGTYNYSYIEAIYNHFLSIIKESVESYSKISKINSSSFTFTNNSLFNMLKNYYSCCTKLRVFTLNYEESFISLYPRFSFFNGFDNLYSDSYGPYKTSNINKIVNVSNINCYYNLHGSFHLDYIPVNRSGLEWVYRPDTTKMSKGSSFSGDSFNQKGEYLINSPIITGYNKVSRLLQQPLFEMYNRFYNDCINSKLIFLIGYSYSDYHINKALSDSVNYSKTILYDINYIDESIYRMQLSGRYSPHLNKIHTKLDLGLGEFKYLREGWMQFNRNKNVNIYYKGFQKFLNDSEWNTL